MHPCEFLTGVPPITGETEVVQEAGWVAVGICFDIGLKEPNPPDPGDILLK